MSSSVLNTALHIGGFQGAPQGRSRLSKPRLHLQTAAIGQPTASHPGCIRNPGVTRRITAAAGTTDSPQPSDIPKNTVLRGRYEVDAVLGRGGNGTTYRCKDAETSQFVAIKALSLRSLKDWKQLELFQREAQTLESLDYPGIPKYIDAFEEDTPTDRAFFLVQQIASGASLEEMVSRGWRADEAEISRIAKELLSTLKYLGSRRPPVIHRDVKPQNIVIEGGRTGGRVFLVDFGGVQSTASVGDSLPGTTVVGTFGFMAPEQFRGAAHPASDLYGLGGTLLYLVSGRPPSAFPVDRMRIDVATVPMGTNLRTVVEGLLEPVLEDRLTADEAFALLNGRKSTSRSSAETRRGVGGAVFGRDKLTKQRRQQQQQQQQQFAGSRQDAMFLETRPIGKRKEMRKPPGSRVQMSKRGPRLIIDIPPAGFNGSTAATGAFAIAWNAFVAFWTVSALAGGGILFALFSLPFWFAGVDLVKKAFGRQFIRERLEIGLNSWHLQQQLAGLNPDGKADWSQGAGKQAEGRTDDLAEAAMQIVAYVNGVPQGQLKLRQGVENFALGEGLDPLEQEWLASVINQHLDELAETREEIIEFVGDDVGEGNGGGGDALLSGEQITGESKSSTGSIATTIGSLADELSSQFEDFDRRLYDQSAAAQQRVRDEVRPAFKAAGSSVREGMEFARQATADARRAAERAANEGEEARNRAAREAERAAATARSSATRWTEKSTRSGSSSNASTIDLGSGEFDVLD